MKTLRAWIISSVGFVLFWACVWVLGMIADNCAVIGGQS